MIHLTPTEFEQRLSTRYIRRVPLTRKEKLENWPLGFIAPPFVLFITFLSRAGTASLQPVVVAIAVGLGWYLFFVIGHRAISREQFKTLTKPEKQQRLVYDSIWHYLWRSGFGFYCVIAFAWGMVEFGITQGQIGAARLLLIIDLVAAVALVINRRWMVVVMLEGFRKHKKVGIIVGIVFGLFSALPAYGGMANIIRVTTTQESRAMLVIPFMILLNLFPITIFVMALLGTLITIAHYRRWKET